MLAGPLRCYIAAWLGVSSTIGRFRFLFKGSIFANTLHKVLVQKTFTNTANLYSLLSACPCGFYLVAFTISLNSYIQNVMIVISICLRRPKSVIIEDTFQSTMFLVEQKFFLSVFPIYANLTTNYIYQDDSSCRCSEKSV